MPITDAFTRADGGVGANYATVAGKQELQVVSNTVRGQSAGNDAASQWTAGPALANDQYAKLTIAAWVDSGSAIAVFVRSGDGAANDDFYMLYVTRQDTTRLYRVDNGTLNLIDSVADPGWAVSDILEIRASGTTISGYRNGSAIAGLSVADATYAGGKAGILINSASDTANVYGDNFEAGDLGTAHTLSPADTITLSDNASVSEVNDPSGGGVSGRAAWTYFFRSRRSRR